MLAIVSCYILTDGTRFRQATLARLSLGVADKLCAKTRNRADGQQRTGTAVFCMRVAQRAWKITWRDKPKQVLSDNPFAGMGASELTDTNEAGYYL